MRPAPRKVGIVAACRFPAPRGSQIHIDEMARALAEAGEDVHLIAPLDPHGPDVPYTRHALSRIVRFRPRPSVSGLHLLERPIFDVLLTIRLLDVVRSEKLEVLHAHNYEGLAAALVARRVFGTRVVYHAHNIAEDELPLYTPRWLAPAVTRAACALDGFLPVLADQVVVLSPDVGKHLARRGVAESRIWEIPPGLNPAPFQAARRAVRAPRAVFAGNCDQYQNLEMLFRAWSLVAAADPHAELRVVTHARGNVLARRRTDALAPRIRIIEAENLAQVAAELGAARVGVSPRSSWSGFPIKTLNYMAAGLPTVALAGSAKGVVEGETGWVVHDNTPGAFAAAISEALAEPRESARRGAAARQRLDQEHCWAKLAEPLLACTRAALGAPDSVDLEGWSRTRRLDSRTGTDDQPAFPAGLSSPQ
jgi:glycosyltransferase involved in cell wall biosynthesis